MGGFFHRNTHPAAQILWRHVLPNVMPPIIIIFSITIGATIVAEASLSFLGFGLPPDVPSWGGMLSREGRQYMTIAPRLAIWPGPFLTTVVYRISRFRCVVPCSGVHFATAVACRKCVQWE